ncbi:MAG: DUF3971 domain-containing protein, partial [Alphaproteobacteria bacterium]|nr:DUF3971 domain-containing protein [Alphaproteobacteria bacterium]
DWVVPNIDVGFVPEVTFNLEGRLTEQLSRFELLDFGGAIMFEEAAVKYFSPLPPATNAYGVARFGNAWFDIDVNRAQLGNIKLKKGKVLIHDIGTKDLIEIKLPVSGPVPEVLELIDQEPLKLLSQMGADFGEAAGVVSGDLEFAFPLIHDLKMDDVEIRAKAQIADADIHIPSIDQAIQADQLALDLSQDKMEVSGTVFVDKTALDTVWIENFKDDAKFRRAYQIVGSLDAAFIRKQGIPVDGYLKGVVDSEIALVQDMDATSRLSGKADLTKADIFIDILNLVKPEGQPAFAEFVLDTPPSGPAELSRFVFSGDQMSVDLTAIFDPDYTALRSLAVDKFRVGKSDFSARYQKAEGGVLKLVLSGNSIDVTGLLKQADEEGEERGEDRLQPGEGGVEGNLPPPFDLEVSVGKIYADIDFPPGKEIQDSDLKSRQLYDFELYASRRGAYLSYLDIFSRLGNGGKASLSYGGDMEVVMGFDQIGVPFRITTTDFGQLLKDLGIRDNVEKGTGRISGIHDLDKNIYSGKIEIGPYTLKNAPTVGRILEAVSLTGLPSALSGSAMNFNELEGGFELGEKVLKLRNFRTHNTSVGLSLDGNYDFDTELLDSQGTVVPAYGINQLLGNVPLIGWILTGGDGGGLLGATFYVTGPSDDLNVTVNPASILTPGFLRRIFDYRQDDETPQDIERD